ncbi:type II CRISPR RNA-guided endonuclease Cas9, partial [Enterococcus cecorum]
QSTKAVAEILSNWFPESEIVYSKAKNVSNFRQDFEILKVRELNDCHHAHDAYLNIVVGNAYHTKFTNSPYRFLKNKANQEYNLRKLLQKANKIESNGVVAWIGQSENNLGTIATVKKVIRRNTVLISRMVKEVDGQLFDLTLMKKGKGQVPIKSSDERLTDISKYGGYNKATGAYFTFVKSKKRGKVVRSFEYVPLHLSKQFENNNELLKEYIEKDRGLTDVEILIPKVLINSLFRYNGSLVRIPSRFNDMRLVVIVDSPLLLENKYIEELKAVSSFVRKKSINKNHRLSKFEIDKLGDLNEMYDVIINKVNASIYQVLSKKYSELVGFRENFVKLDEEEKCKIIYELLHLFQCNVVYPDLQLIGGVSKFGRLSITKGLKEYDKMSIIHQSPSGIFEHEIELTSL